MKKYIILNLIILFVYCNTNAGVPIYSTHFNNNYQDTNKYLNDIIAKKDKFQHKSLNTLFGSLNIKAKSYSLLRGKRLSDPYKGIILFFEDGITNSNKLHNKMNVPSLIISFDNEVPFRKAMGLFSKTLGEWGQQENDFYGDMTIKDIEKNREK